MRCPTFLLIFGVVGVACALRIFLVIRTKPVGLPESVGLACTTTLGAFWGTYNWKLDMAALSRLGIGCDDPLSVWAQQVAPWVAPSVAPPMGPVRVGHGCGVPPAVRSQQVAAPETLELVAVLRWQGFAPLDMAAAPLELGSHTTCPSC